MTARPEPAPPSGKGIWESRALRDLRLASEARGLTFYANPDRAVIPEFLGNYQPDAIALGPEGGVVIEIKNQRSGAAKAALAEISQRVAGQKGWEFRVIYLNPPANEVPPITRPSAKEIRAAIDEAISLRDSQHYAAAFVTAWATLEALTRVARASAEDTWNPISPLQTVQLLAEDGFLENETAARLRDFARLRNAIVHGDLSVKVGREPVEELIRQLQAIASEVGASAEESLNH